MTSLRKPTILNLKMEDDMIDYDQLKQTNELKK